MAVNAGVRDDGGGAERAFGGMGVRVVFGLRTAIGAGDDAGFLDLGLGELVADRGLEVELAQAACGGAVAFDGLRVAAMVAGQPVGAGVVAQVGPAIVAGKAVLGVGGRDLVDGGLDSAAHRRGPR